MRDDDLFTQVCFVTNDLKKAVERWATLAGAGPFFESRSRLEGVMVRGEPINEDLRIALGFSGTTFLEIIEPHGPPHSLYTETLATQGEGAIHHVNPGMMSRTTEELEEQRRLFENQGLEAVMTIQVPGGGTILFFDARKDIGCYIEVSGGFTRGRGQIMAMYELQRRRVQGPALRPFRDLIAHMNNSVPIL